MLCLFYSVGPFSPVFYAVALRVPVIHRAGNLLVWLGQCSKSQMHLIGNLMLFMFTEKVVLKPNDVSVFTTLTINGRLFACPREQFDSLVSVYSLLRAVSAIRKTCLELNFAVTLNLVAKNSWMLLGFFFFCALLGKPQVFIWYALSFRFSFVEISQVAPLLGHNSAFRPLYSKSPPWNPPNLDSNIKIWMLRPGEKKNFLRPDIVMYHSPSWELERHRGKATLWSKKNGKGSNLCRKYQRPPVSSLSPQTLVPSPHRALFE